MTSKAAYLTIDDAPSPAMSAKVDCLSARGIPTVWFCQGTHLEQRPEEALYAIGKGFVLGNHAYDHPYFSDLSLAEGLEQIRRTDEILDGLYRRAGVKRPAKYFRFPYGDKGGGTYSEVLEPYSASGLERKQALQAYLRHLGYTQPRLEAVTYRYFRDAGLHNDVDWYWTYDAMEWTVFTAEPEFGISSLEKVLARMDEDEPEGRRGLNDPRSAEIVLVHDHLNTTAFFEPIIARLVEKGLAFASPEPSL